MIKNKFFILTIVLISGSHLLTSCATVKEAVKEVIMGPSVEIRKIKPFGPIEENQVQKQKEIPEELIVKELTVIVDVANVREEPGTEYKIIGKAKKGEKLKQLDEKEGWFKVKIPNGQIGWIYGKLVKEDTPILR